MDTPTLSTRTLLILATGLLVPAAASVWLMTMPETITPSAYSIGAAVFVGLAALTLLSRGFSAKPNVRINLLDRLHG